MPKTNPLFSHSFSPPFSFHFPFLFSCLWVCVCLCSFASFIWRQRVQRIVQLSSVQTVCSGSCSLPHGSLFCFLVLLRSLPATVHFVVSPLANFIFIPLDVCSGYLAPVSGWLLCFNYFFVLSSFFFLNKFSTHSYKLTSLSELISSHHFVC